MDVVLGVCHKKTSFKKLALPCGAHQIAFFSLNFGLKLKFVVLIGRANFAVSSVSCARHQLLFIGVWLGFILVKFWEVHPCL